MNRSITTLARVTVTLLLAAGIVVCLLSQSILFVIGPVLGGLGLWVTWAGVPKHRESLSEPPPLYGRE